ncbi:T-cell leukemia translocation-altered gene protein homolog isoform X2 [Narcine bancroftii]|uniref:T-cell leukemia translocation-altered gene protein homolog isoform X2 n=1 Tax=Narcine bancroftii TaxID=1343680 RepID=UPI003831DFFD
MELPWDLGLFSGLVQSALSFCSEFARDWGANDMRVTVFKILLGWLLCSLVAIHLAWKFYGATVNDMYYRQDAIKIFSRIRCPSFTGANQHSSFSPSRKKRYLQHLTPAGHGTHLFQTDINHTSTQEECSNLS